MVPNAASIARRRHKMRTIVRGVALVLIGLFLARAIVGGIALAASMAGVDVFGTFLIEQLLAGSGPLLIGVGLLLFEKRLIAWLVPIPRSRCPKCDYFLVSLVELRCPECGLPLTPEFLDHPSQTDPRGGPRAG